MVETIFLFDSSIKIFILLNSEKRTNRGNVVLIFIILFEHLTYAMTIDTEKWETLGTMDQHLVSHCDNWNHQIWRVYNGQNNDRLGYWVFVHC